MACPQAVVIFHGIGIGGEPYAYGLSAGQPGCLEVSHGLQLQSLWIIPAAALSQPGCLEATADCHIFVPELPQLSYRLAPGKPLTAEQGEARARSPTAACLHTLQTRLLQDSTAGSHVLMQII